MNRKQRTIKKEFSLSGIGLHTGDKIDITFKPAEEDTGINFIRVDLDDKLIIKADLSNVIDDNNVLRCTSIGKNGSVINTVEHLTSVLSSLEIDNLEIEINGEEVPGLDGSANDFLSAFKKVGIVEQNSEVAYFEIKEPVGVSFGGCSIYAVPSKEFKISYVLDYDNPLLTSQFFDITVDSSTFEKELAPCRTFCLESEAAALKNEGLGKGANYKNTLVVGKKGVLDNKVRFDNEFARHKVLDFIGDLYLLGAPVKGHFFAVKSGHSLNIALAKKIKEQMDRYNKNSIIKEYDYEEGSEIDINGIMKILPHRYPFLMVDRILELQEGKRAVGIKNVTINDGFFRGHFPAKPVMPGVLMVEAMAQVAGIALLTNDTSKGKLALFMAVNNVKFRKVVVPGDQLVMEVVIIKKKSRVAIARGIAKVGDAVVAEADITLSFADSSQID